MASFLNASFCATLALVLWSCVGLSLSLRLLPGSLAWPVAPALGWAVHSAISLPIFCLTGMARPTVIITATLSMIIAWALLLKRPKFTNADDTTSRVPISALAAAVILAAAIMAAILPTATGSGFALAGPIFDHSKVSMIDEMARLGVPAGNPFFGEVGGPSRLAYYYLWHFSAAELAVLTGLSGWNADAGMTWFTAFSSLTMMAGFANWLSGRSTAAYWVLVLSATTTIRPFIVSLLGWKIANEFTGWPSGFGAWLFQVTWAPQHVASAGCSVILTFLLIQMAHRRSALNVFVFALIAVAGFESSTWVGGIAFPLAAAAIVSMLIFKIGPKARIDFVASLAVGAVLAIVIAWPFIYDQALASVARASGSPIGIMPYDVLGSELSEPLRLVFDLPAYWSIYLLVEFAAFYPAGILMMIWLSKDESLSPDRKTLIVCFGLLATISLAVGSLLVSTIGANNDLGWRGVLPAVLVLIVVSAAGIVRYLFTMQSLYAVAILSMIGLACFSGVRDAYKNIYFQHQASSDLFGKSAKMWDAVRSHSEKDERIANNPLFLSDMTNWPINISWALLSNRRSCYAGSDLALPFIPLPKQHRAAIDTQFTRVFEGRPEPSDLAQLAGLYNCGIVVITPHDGAWTSDPFASSHLYDLVETDGESWRIYKRRTPPPA